MTDYVASLAHQSKAELVDMVTDQLVAPRTHYVTRQSLLRWARDAEASVRLLVHDKEMSWKVLLDPGPRAGRDDYNDGPSEPNEPLHPHSTSPR